MICPNCSKQIDITDVMCSHCKQSIREEVVQNWQREIEQVVLGYEEHHGLVHGLQKDAIQNGWGHRVKNSAKDWCFEFYLFEIFDNINILTMTDIGGYGLTGKNMSRAEIPDELPEYERLARFEHMKFSGGNTQGAGLFGRGKLLFTAASEESHIIYDSLTEDGKYRLNERRLIGRRFDNFAKAYEDDNARDMLEQLIKGHVKPLNNTGTRIIIIKPKEEIVKAIKDGAFIDYITETWWQIPLKFEKRGAKIVVKTDKGVQQAKIPKEFSDVFIKKSNKYKVRMHESNNKIEFDYKGIRLQIKKTCFIVSPKPIPVQTRGIYLYRREMKIANLELKNVPEEIEDKFYGYAEIETDSELEKIYLDEKCEGPEHYSVAKKGIIRKLKTELQLHFEDFKAELGYKENTTKMVKEKTRRALLESLDELNRKMRELGVSISASSSKNDIMIRLKSIKFPRENENMVNINESIEKIKFKLINRSTWSRDLSVSVSTRKVRGETIETMFEDRIVLKGQDSKIVGPFSCKILLPKYPKERQIYICCTATDVVNGKILATNITPVFIEVNPPAADAPPVELTIQNITFPRGKSNRRVNYKEVITNIVYSITNKTPEKIKAVFKARALNAMSKSNEIEKIKEEMILLDPFSTQELQCPNIDVDKEKYSVLDREMGPVILRATLTAEEASKKFEKAVNIFTLKNKRKPDPLERKQLAISTDIFDRGDKLAKYDFKFWVNMDSGKGVFEDYRAWEGGPEEPCSKIQPESGGFICLLNETHPAYENLLENYDEDAIRNYTYEQLVRQTLNLILKRDILEYWPEVRGSKYKERMMKSDSDNFEKVEAFTSTLDYLYGEYLG